MIEIKLNCTETEEMTHKYAVTVYNGVEAMRDSDHCAFFELVSYGFLDQLVCPVLTATTKTQ